MTALFGLYGEALVAAVKALPDEETQAAHERVTVSEHSPGPVGDDEYVVRSCDQPIHVAADGTLDPAAFGEIETHGLSVQRSPRVSDAEIWRRADARVAQRRESRRVEGKPDDDRRTVAVVKWLADDLRQQRSQESQRRMLGIFDTAKRDDRGHADVVSLLPGRGAARKARKVLYESAKDKLMRRVEPEPLAGAPANEGDAYTA